MRLPTACTLTVVLLLTAGTAPAADTSRTAVPVTVQVSSRTSLRVSNELLQFALEERAGVATATVDFAAGARVASDSDVVLSIEPLRSIVGPGGAADTDASVDFAGQGDGTISGTLGSASPSIAGRWHGSGMRQGRVTFTLHAAAAGVYSLPVRFVLSTP
jgi:hypothetical protein